MALAVFDLPKKVFSWGLSGRASRDQGQENNN
jgi:hypothetical protein